MQSNLPCSRLKAWLSPDAIDDPGLARRVAFDSLRGVLALLLVLLHMAQQHITVLPQALTHQCQISVRIPTHSSLARSFGDSFSETRMMRRSAADLSQEKMPVIG